jgi:hypothetical protein
VYKDISKSIQEKIEEEKRVSKKLRDQINKIQSLDNILEEKKEMIEKVKLLELNNLTPKNLTYLVKIIKDISTEYNLSRSIALSRFIGEIKANYKPILGFREEIKKLEKQISNLENKIKQQKNEYSSIQKTNDLRKEALRAMGTINNLGISDAEILSLKNYLLENEQVLPEFQDERERARTINDDIKKLKELINHFVNENKNQDSSSIILCLNLLEETHNKLIDLLNKIEKT